MAVSVRELLQFVESKKEKEEVEALEVLVEVVPVQKLPRNIRTSVSQLMRE